jgi:hypothetical protein
LRVLAAQDRPVWTQMSFHTAEDNFTEAAVKGIHATQYWPGYGEVPVAELVLRRILPLAHQGLREWGVDDAVRERLLGVIEGRCITERNGAAWQVATVHRLEEQGMDRLSALAEMTRRYVEHMHANEPVHTWSH